MESANYDLEISTEVYHHRLKDPTVQQQMITHTQEKLDTDCNT